jgi:hypothetical protein
MASRARNRGAMSRFKIAINDSDLQRIQGFLAGMSLGVQSGILAHAFAYAGKPIVSAAKGYAARFSDTGLLAKSIGCFVKINKKTKQPYALITASGRYRQRVVRKSGKEEVANPQKYLHLVELGTRHSPAQPMLEPAIIARGQEASDRVIAGVERATDAMIKRYERKIMKNIGLK